MTYRGEYIIDSPYQYQYLHAPLKRAFDRLAEARDFDSAREKIREMPEEEYQALRRQCRADTAVYFDRIRETQETPMRVGVIRMKKSIGIWPFLDRLLDEAGANDADDEDDHGGKSEAEDEAPADADADPVPVRGP